MKLTKKALIFIFFLFQSSQASLPQGFVYLKDVSPEIRQSVRYHSSENFTGKRVSGYGAPKIILTEKAALALKKVNAELQKEGFTLVVYDGYRPQMAVDEFLNWGRSHEQSKKSYYFPEISKEDIFKRGFVSGKSSHSRGSTVDLTIIQNELQVCKVKPIKRGKFIFLDDCTEDMGMHWDFLGSESWAESPLMAKEFNEKRKFLVAKMEKYGFKVAKGEWWHFTLKDEPYPKTYFNFKIQ